MHNIDIGIKSIDKIYHIADVHVRNVKRHKEYREVFKQLYSAARQLPENSLIYIAGDIVHNKTDISPELISITSEFFTDETALWNPFSKPDDHKYRVKLKPNIVLDAKFQIDALILGPRLEYVKRWVPEDWPLAFLDRLHLIPQRDFRLIEGEMKRLLPKNSRKS